MPEPNMRICPVSSLIVPTEMHGNQLYHPSILKEVKRQNNKERYARTGPICNLALQLDNTLNYYFPFSLGKLPIAKSLLDKCDFKWDFNSRISDDITPPIFWIIDYGYSWQNKYKNQIIIHHEQLRDMR